MVLTTANSSNDPKMKMVQPKNQMSINLMLLTRGRLPVPVLCVSVMNVSHVEVPSRVRS